MRAFFRSGANFPDTIEFFARKFWDCPRISTKFASAHVFMHIILVLIIF